MTTFTDNGPDYQCPRCGADTSGEIGHECGEEEGGEGMRYVYAVINKVFFLLFEDVEDAEDYLSKEGTAANGLRIERYFVIPKSSIIDCPAGGEGV